MGILIDSQFLCFQALKQLPREKVQLATKFGILRSGDFQFKVKGTPEYVRKCCEASLKRLGVDYIDLYYQHRVDVSVKIEDTVRLFSFDLSFCLWAICISNSILRAVLF